MSKGGVLEKGKVGAGDMSDKGIEGTEGGKAMRKGWENEREGYSWREKEKK